MKTQEEHDRAIAMYQAGEPVEKICDEIGINYVTLNKWTRVAGLPPRPAVGKRGPRKRPSLKDEAEHSPAFCGGMCPDHLPKSKPVLPNDLEGRVVAHLDSNALSMWVLDGPPRIHWSDGPRSDTESFPTLVDALRSFTDAIVNDLDLYGDEAFAR